jgi:hypothetical protein
LSYELETARKYRDRAAELLAMAQGMKNSEQSRILLAIAAMYHRLAEQFEAIERAKGPEGGA